MVTVDWRPWWHSMQMLAFTGSRLPLSSFLVLKVRVAPLGNGTLTTARMFGNLAPSWQVVHMKPLATGWELMPEISRVPALEMENLPPLAMNWGRPVELWHLAQP